MEEGFEDSEAEELLQELGRIVGEQGATLKALRESTLALINLAEGACAELR